MAVDNRLTDEQLAALAPGDRVTIEFARDFRRPKYVPGQVVRSIGSQTVVSCRMSDGARSTSTTSTGAASASAPSIRRAGGRQRALARLDRAATTGGASGRGLPGMGAQPRRRRPASPATGRHRRRPSRFGRHRPAVDRRLRRPAVVAVVRWSNPGTWTYWGTSSAALAARWKSLSERVHPLPFNDTGWT